MNTQEERALVTGTGSCSTLQISPKEKRGTVATGIKQRLKRVCTAGALIVRRGRATCNEWSGRTRRTRWCGHGHAGVTWYTGPGGTTCNEKGFRSQCFSDAHAECCGATNGDGRALLEELLPATKVGLCQKSCCLPQRCRCSLAHLITALEIIQ